MILLILLAISQLLQELSHKHLMVLLLLTMVVVFNLLV